ncbi:hypothetical protein Tco_1376956 [Tanacetum coccineum]
MGLWYSKDTGMSLTTYADADHVGCQDTRRSTSGCAQFLDDKLLAGRPRSKTKHIDVRYHFIKKQVENGIVELYFVRTEYHLEKRLEIGKCNGRLNPRKIQREPTFQVVLDALALTPCYSAFLITADVPEVYLHQFWDLRYLQDLQGQDFYALHTDEEIMSFLRDLGHTREINSLNDVVLDHMHQPWRTFTALINRILSRRQLVLTSFISPEHKSFRIVSWRNKIGMHTSKDDYLINTLRFVSTKEIEQIYDAILPESLTSSEMKETKAYKTYLGYATGATPPKKARNSRSQLLLNSLRETPKIPLSKKKEKVDVARGKGIEMLSDVALIKEDQYEEVRKKSLRDFHKTHPSGSGTVTKTAPSAAKIKPSVTNEGTGVKPGVPNVTKESSESEAGSWGNDEDDNNNEQDLKDSDHETDENESGSESDQEENKEDEDDEEEVNDKFVKTPSNDYDDEDETNITDKAEGDEDEEMDYTTSQLYDDVDIRLNEPVDTDKGFIQEEGTNAEMTNIQQGNENPEISQVIEDAYVTLSTVPQKTEVLVTSSSHSSDLVAKFLNFLDIPHTDVKIISPMDVHVHHEVPSQQTPTLLSVPISVISDSSPVFSTVIL